jgi:hypothetical protein
LPAGQRESFCLMLYGMALIIPPNMQATDVTRRAMETT